MIDKEAQATVQRFYDAANAGIARGDPRGALHSIEQALAIVPAHPAVCRLHGRILGILGHDAAAADVFRSVTELEPSDTGAWVDLGMALSRLSRDADAIGALQQAVALDPTHEAALELLANVSYRRGDLGQALAIGRRAVAAAPHNGNAISNLCFATMIACDWPALPDLYRRLDASTDAALAAGQAPAETPHLSVIRCHDPVRNLAIARAASASIAERANRQAPPMPMPERSGRERIRVGYLCAQFRDHPAAHLCGGIFERHDRSRFEIIGFADGPPNDDLYRRRVDAGVDRMVDIGALEALEAAQKIRDEAIDVLMLIGGHTRGTRLEICAFRPAPIQIAYFDFPGSLGAAFIDYAIVDDTVLPPALATHFTERPIYLPFCYQPNDDRQLVAVPPPSRAACNLPADAVVLAAPVSVYKIEPSLFACWMRLLASEPSAVLWLPGCNEIAARNLHDAARAHGIEAARIVVAGRIAKPAHLARLALADLALDSWLCNGHTTTSDCLFAGVPVVATLGAHFATRVSASILRAAGLPELVANDPDHYETMIRMLIRDSMRRAQLRQVLAQDRSRIPLFDTARYVRALEAGIAAAWQRHQAGESAATIRVCNDGGASVVSV